MSTATETAASLYLSNQKGLAVLQAILAKGMKAAVSHVYSARDPNVLRDFFDDILSTCNAHSIPCQEVDPRRPRTQLAPSSLALAVGWRWIIKNEPRLVVFHDSLLPRYRGFAPLVSCLLNGESKIGVTALLATEHYDQGPIIGQKASEIKYPITIQEAIDAVIPLYQELAIDVMRELSRNEDITTIPQDSTQATYSLWRGEEDYRIDWSASADSIVRFIHALGAPYLGASSRFDGELKVRILDAESVQDVRIEIRDAGKVFQLDNGLPIVVCGQGLLRIKEMVHDSTRQSLLPLQRLRVRFR
jgi:methionyl-tRNA formyltransferase